MDQEVDPQVDPRISCKVCGEREFNLRDGFFYCTECGTIQENVREIEVDKEDVFNDIKHQKKIKISKIKEDKIELTSWESYNYILRGLVEELMSYGAKEELKLMSLQLWAAYLRSMEVAFFSKKNPELPKLGVRYLSRDARVLYNHTKKLRKQKRTRSETGSMASGERNWRRKKRKLDESNYSAHSQSSLNTSSTGTTSHAIQLKYSSWSRKILKKRMSVKHLEKHEKDAEGNMECHKTKPLVTELNRNEHTIAFISIKHMYSILAIALNLIGDDITLSDLVRFTREGHLGTKNVLQYFPENIAMAGKELLREIDFYQYKGLYPDKMVREHVSLMAKTIRLQGFKQVDILKLATRYITELNLPSDITTYVERLINILPPTMKTRFPHIYPQYEGRAMAYVIFVLKLLFGLDGHKEKLISRSARKINGQIKRLGEHELGTHPLLFVWSDWVQYIEMRKVIVSQSNSNFCHQFRECRSTALLLEELDAEHRKESEKNATAEMPVKNSDSNRSKRDNLRITFDKLLQSLDAATPPKTPELISFSPTLTPAHSYFKRILLNASNSDSAKSIAIPEYMRVDHMQRTLQPLLQSRTLREFFSRAQWTLRVQRLPCTPNRTFVGTFQPRTNGHRHVMARKANFATTESAWRASITDKPIVEDLEFKTALASYSKDYLARRKHRIPGVMSASLPNWLRKAKGAGQQQPSDEGNDVPTANESTVVGPGNKGDLESVHSFDLFSENNMTPYEGMELAQPRRNLEKILLFADISDDEAEEACMESPLKTEENSKTSKGNKSSNDEAITENELQSRTLTLVTSALDCWTLPGTMGMITDIQKKTLKSKFPRSFSWLLETCAQTIGLDWAVLYEQFLAIELMFLYGTEKLDKYENCIFFDYNIQLKDINKLLVTIREIW